jgi:TPP-dependent pyruvate/acetoin dehydrogenase alpha subunit
MSPEDLIKFENDIAELFNSGVIRSPVHLYSGGEEDLIRIFKDIRPQDWVLCSWRSHYQCLLKGVPASELKAKIMAGYSIALSFPEYRVLSSAMVGGVLPIAVGLGMAIKRSGEDARVNVFCGDMSAETGTFHESVKYATNFGLPVRFFVEDNGLSVCSPTKRVWGLDAEWRNPNVFRFEYEATKFPHAGGGVRVQF